MSKRIEEYPYFAQPVDPSSESCRHLVTRLGREEPCLRTLRVGRWGGVPLCPYHRKQAQAWLDEAAAGSPAEVWAWLGENGRQTHLPGLRYTQECYAIFLGNGEVGYNGLFFDNKNYFLKYPFVNSRRRALDGRIISSDARLVVKRVI